MSLAGLLLVLTAAVCHATWNFCVKLINGGAELIWLFSLVSTLVYLPLVLWILIVDAPVFSTEAVVFILGSVALHLGYFLLLQTGYRRGDLSLVYPVARATGPVLSASFAILFLGEQVNAQLVVGAMIIIFGVFMLTGGIRRTAGNVTTSLAFGLGAGALIGSYTAWDAYTVAVLLVPPLLLDYAASIGRVVILAPIAIRKRSLVRDHWQNHRTAVLVIGVLNSLAYILVLYAFQFTPVTYVAPIREVSVPLAVLAGSLLLGEGQIAWRVGWACVIFAGIAVLASS